MSQTETVNLTVNMAEVRSISDVATTIANEIQSFAAKHGVGEQYDSKATEADLIYFMAKREKLGLERLEVHILEDGEIAVGSFKGRRRATLIFNINYAGRTYSP
jgi:hypothetical protein